eukprot:TRINITY_DN8598_c0_g1_i1.p2 TRINITY_DN8598_c0_g1~~TRINITY_DN8598_c0_g1_i1.p2  ORF type:complete len:205 (+),score=66.61 TRINITY_DN8598_c0_g1_i1:122-736(+)
MAKRKPLSFDEKRERLLNIFHDRKEVLNLKELEKYGSKAGIVLQTVKEVLDSLVGDSLVEGDKIGAANFFWSLPSKTYQTINFKIKEYNENSAKAKETIDSLRAQIAEGLKTRPETRERQAQMERLRKMKLEYESKKKQIDVYMKNDPERLKKLNNEAKELKDKANVWTDNVFVARQWLRDRNPGISDSEVNKMFEIPEDFDNI